MNFIWDKITEWLKEVLVGSIMENFTGMFSSINERVADIATQVGATPQGWNASIYSMVHNLSQTVILPIAGVVLAIIMAMELIQLVLEKNNMHDLDTWIFFKWVFKTFCAVTIVTNTWNIVMGVFEMAQSVVQGAAGVVIADTSIDIETAIVDLEVQLMAMDIGPLLGMWFQSLFVMVIMQVLSVGIFVIVIGRMIEIYLVTSIAPLPLATMTHREWGQIGQNYLRSLLALGFQAFLIIVCVAIYAVLIQQIYFVPNADVLSSVWTCIAYSVMLCYGLFNCSAVSKRVFNVH